ncbi:unnamed protein product [Spirodela intermedia]|uniref:Exocyst subunit Exo70 family protein n=1 Tax=Spirodela intermedia TaxID=51605 RepID=A0A7I8J7T9_SPIIN|nr:unnamed protein product [Spirodela intermedia]CAA6666149.1 unnamed protein product [Spirodela intermedia]
MGPPQGIEVLRRRASVLRESLQKSQTNTDAMVSILGSFDHRLSALEAAMRPIQVRTHAIRRAHENIDKTLKSAAIILSQFDLSREAEAKILKGPHEDLESYWRRFEQLRSNVASSVQTKASKVLFTIIHLYCFLFFSKPLEPENLFDCLPNSLRPSYDPQGNQGDPKILTYKPLTLISPRILPLLHELAQQMVQAGAPATCFKNLQVSCGEFLLESRTSVMEQTLRKLGVEKLSKDECRRCSRTFVSGERKVCDQIFDGMDSLRDQCFSEFGDAIAKSKRSPEKLFVLLDMYELMRELQPEIERIFSGKACSEMRDAALSLTRRCYENTVSDGTVHPLTSYVINYVKFLFDEDNECSSDKPGWKSKQYRDPALTYIFLMNNIHYMVRSVRRSEAKDLLGDDWVQRHRRVVQQNANQYRGLLGQSGGSGMGGDGGGAGPGGQGIGNISGVSRATVKERFKSFNAQFEELHQRQSQWSVPDLELRESLRLSIAEVLLPAYRSFIKRFGPMIESGKNPQKYYRYAPEVVDRLLGEFFEGRSGAS